MAQSDLIPIDSIQSRICFLRGEKIMFDRDLAWLYGVETKALNQAVRRNYERFPADFMFQLNEKEFLLLKSQIVTSSWGGTRRPPFAFTEQGIAMLSSVLKSPRAIQVHIQIIRTFTKIRRMLLAHRELNEKLEVLEKKYDKKFRVVFDTMKLLLKEEQVPKNKIGFCEW